MKRFTQIAPLVLLPVVIAACGSGSPKATTSASSPPEGIAQAAYKFAACMRDHGVPNFPDPIVSQHDGGTSVAIHVIGGPNASPATKTANKDCQGILPSPQQQAQSQAAQQRAHLKGLLSFAHCMRGHGVTSFPDPTSQGQMTLEMISSAGVDIHAQSVLAAIKACAPQSDGVVTPQVVAQAEAQG